MKRSGTERNEVLLIAPCPEPIVEQLRQLLETQRPVEVYYANRQDELTRKKGRLEGRIFSWLGPLSAIRRNVDRLNRYGLIVNYYFHRNGYVLGLLARCVPRNSRARLVWVGCTPRPPRPGVLGRIREIVVRQGLQGYDLLVCNTRSVIEAIEQRYPEVSHRLRYARWGGTGDQDFDESTDKGYVFCGGRTNRDFSTVFKAVAQLGCPTIFAVEQGAELPAEHPDFISVLRDISVEHFRELVRDARIVVVSLKRPDISSGQVVLNMAMRSRKPVVVSNIAGLDDYVIDGEDAVLFAPGDVEDLKAKLQWLLANPERRNEIGRAARATYERSFNSRVFARELFDVLSDAEVPAQRGDLKMAGDG
jgi:glycosyltransferase involved in cell wall biosynthesis